MSPRIGLLGVVVLSAIAGACTATQGDNGGLLQAGAGGQAGQGDGGGPASGGSKASGGGGLLNIGGMDGGGGNTIVCNGTKPDEDGDGFTVEQGDCNDCDANANPGALDVAGNQIDEDCNGVADDNSTECDAVITDLASNDPKDAVRAIGLCKFTTLQNKDWGVISTRYVMADGTEGMNDVSHGLLPAFGTNLKTREGKRLLALSSGTARQPTDPGYEEVSGFDTDTTGTTPPGFPKDSPACSGVQTATDTSTFNPAALEVKIRVPTNAKSLKFKFDFYTYEFPSFVCTQYNDFFVALQDPPSPNAQSGNISFDSQGNPVSVNNGYLEVCSPQEAGGKQFPCKLGTSELQGTGFDESAATGWLETVSPVKPGSIVTLRFAVWDMGDAVLDSTVLIDDFQFSAEPATSSVTKPVPIPK